MQHRMRPNAEVDESRKRHKLKWVVGKGDPKEVTTESV